MLEFFQNLSPVMQALTATIFTWGMTALGAAIVFATKTVHQKLLDSMLGFAGGVMIAASYWSLLGPSIEASTDNAVGPWFPALVGFLLGGGFLWIIDKILPHLHPNAEKNRLRGLQLIKENAAPCLCSLSRFIIFQKDWRLELPLAHWLIIVQKLPWLEQLH